MIFPILVDRRYILFIFHHLAINEKWKTCALKKNWNSRGVLEVENTNASGGEIFDSFYYLVV